MGEELAGREVTRVPGERTQPDEPMGLDEPAGPFKAAGDARPRMPEPLPVKLVTVDDARLVTPAGLEVELDEFYVGLLGFQRVAGSECDVVSYRAENFDLHFDVLEPPVRRESLRAIGVEVASLAEVELKLIEREVPYTRQKGLVPGRDALVLADPAGNWVELTESRLI